MHTEWIDRHFAPICLHFLRLNFCYKIQILKNNNKLNFENTEDFHSSSSQIKNKVVVLSSTLFTYLYHWCNCSDFALNTYFQTNNVYFKAPLSGPSTNDIHFVHIYFKKVLTRISTLNLYKYRQNTAESYTKKELFSP